MTALRTTCLLLCLATTVSCATTESPTPATPGAPGEAGPQPGDPATAGLAQVVDSVITTPPLHRTHWGIEVFDATRGTMLLQRSADKLFSTASNAKLPTVAAALERLGAEYRWRTAIEAAGVRDGVAAALVVRGSGDPTLSDHFHPEALAPLDSIADSLAVAGIERIDGPVIIDQSRFDSLLVHPAWEHFDLDWYYAAPVAPFAILEGAYPVVMRPRGTGTPADVDVLLPPGLMATDARVMTVPGERGWNDDLRRITGADSVILRGEIGAAAGPDTSWIAQADPGRLAGRALVAALDGRGIAVTGPVIVTRDPAAALAALGDHAEGGTVRTVWTSPDLAAVARIALEQSDNWVTEQILKTLGAEHGEGGSWSAATAVVEDFLDDRVGVAPGSHYLRDGSGLTSQTLMTPAAVVALLRYASTRPWSDAFRDAMVAPGEREGTLEDRLLAHSGRLVAKTGTLTHVNALSGYAETADGRALVFSMLSASSGRPGSEVRRAMDRIVDTIINGGS